MENAQRVVKNWVRYDIDCGRFFDECESRDFTGRFSPDRAASEAPSMAIGFRTYAREDLVDAEGRIFKGEARPTSPYYWINAEIFDRARVESEVPDNRILLSKMRSNRWDAVVRTRRGGFRPFDDEDETVEVAA